MSKQLESILSRATTATPAAKPESPIAVKPSTAVEPQRPIQAHVPASVARAVMIRAAEEGTTVRTIILQGLRAIGIDVPEAEIRDKRR